jgi:hypothetical protein
MVTYEDWRTEQEKLRTLKAEVDRVCREITGPGIMDRDRLRSRTEELRSLCREMFPDRLELFEMVYQARFKRLWEQFGNRG